MQTIEGLFAPLATPFTDDASTISEIRFARQIRYLLNNPVDGFIVGSDSGEFATVSSSERKQLVEWTARFANGKPFMVHVSSLSTAVSLDLAQHAARYGARAAILMPPFYGDYTTDEMVSFYRTIAHHSGVTIVIVDPQETITSEVRAGLAEVPEVVFAKPLQDVRYGMLSCYKGLTTSDEFAVSHCIASPLALLRPKQVANAIEGETADLAKLIILEETLGRARVSKTGMEVLGIDLGPPRPPLKSLTGSVRAALKTLLEVEG